MNKGDREYMRKAMRVLGVRYVHIATSTSTKKYPDIWVNPMTREITVTQEWARQSAPERQKRLTHELLHLTGLQHSNVLGYSTYPDKDKFSKVVYDEIRRIK